MHLLVSNWVKANQTGHSQPFFPEPYNWHTYGQLNQEFIEKHQGTSLEAAKQLLEKSHEEMMTRVSAFSNDTLFTKHYFPWIKTTLGSYFVSSLSSHYEWAIKKLKQQIKADKR